MTTDVGAEAIGQRSHVVIQEDQQLTPRQPSACVARGRAAAVWLPFATQVVRHFEGVDGFESAVVGSVSDDENLEPCRFQGLLAEGSQRIEHEASPLTRRNYDADQGPVPLSVLEAPVRVCAHGSNLSPPSDLARTPPLESVIVTGSRTRALETRMRGASEETDGPGGMHGGPVEVSVVICTYSQRRWPDLVRAIESVRSQAPTPREVIIVADYNAALYEQARRQWPDVIVVENRSIRGLSGARNTAVARASGDVVAFLDDDAVADRLWLERIANVYDEPGVVAVGGAVVPEWVRGRPRWFPPEFDWVVGCSHSGMPRTPLDVRNLVGANMSLRRDAVVRLGGFQTGLGRVDGVPSGCEETELCIRIREHWPRGRIVYDPSVVVRHTVPPERTTLRYYLSRCRAEGRSKALLCALVGKRPGLSEERHYTRRTLPAGVGRGLIDVVRSADAAGAARAALIVVGLAATFGGYLEGRVAWWRTGRSELHHPRDASGEPNA
jgi:glucosyl-dolichyl phosphate glucuronosyltransferase